MKERSGKGGELWKGGRMLKVSSGGIGENCCKGREFWGSIVKEGTSVESRENAEREERCGKAV